MIKNRVKNGGKGEAAVEFFFLPRAAESSAVNFLFYYYLKFLFWGWTVRGSNVGSEKIVFSSLQNFRTGCGATQPPVQWAAGSFSGGKATGT